MAKRIISINDVGRLGVMKDIPSHELPPAAWSDGNNIRFDDLSVQTCNGYSDVATPSIVPYAIFYCPYSGVKYFLYLGLAKAYGMAGASHADVTRAGGDYTGGPTSQWNGGMFNGIAVVNNGVDYPQAWNAPSLSQVLVNLPTWPADTYAQVIRPFKNFLIALDVTESGTRNSRMIGWSHSADPGTLPSSWDHTDATKDAGVNTLPEGEDQLVDCLQLGNTNVIYTEQQVWGQTLSGTGSIFNFNKHFDAFGMLAQGCAAAFAGQHFVVTQDDIVVHDMSRVQSVAEKAVRNWFFSNLQSSAFFLTTVVPHRENREMWICFPSSGSLLDTALVWNWVTGAWSVRDLPDVRGIIPTLYAPSAEEDLWDTGPDITWDAESDKTWDGPRASPSAGILMSPVDTSGLLLVDSTNRFDGVNFRSFIERTGIAAVGMSPDGKVIVDATRVKLLTGIAPRFVASNGVVVKVYVGQHDTPEGTVTWDNPQNFTIGTDYMLSAYRTGRYLAVRFEATANEAWKLQGYDLEIAVLGEL